MLLFFDVYKFCFMYDNKTKKRWKAFAKDDEIIQYLAGAAYDLYCDI